MSTEILRGLGQRLNNFFQFHKLHLNSQEGLRSGPLVPKRASFNCTSIISGCRPDFEHQLRWQESKSLQKKGKASFVEEGTWTNIFVCLVGGLHGQVTQASPHPHWSPCVWTLEGLKYVKIYCWEAKSLEVLLVVVHFFKFSWVLTGPFGEYRKQ